MTEEIKPEISEMDAETLKHLEARMSDVKKILSMHADNQDAKTIASRMRVAESYVEHVIEVGDADKMMDELTKQYGTPYLKTVIGKAKEKIAEVRAKTPAKVVMTHTSKPEKPAAKKEEKKPKAEKKAKTEKPAKAASGVMNSRNLAILDILKASKGMTKEDIGKATNAKLGINRASWDTPMYELKKANLVTFDATTKLYNVA